MGRGKAKPNNTLIENDKALKKPKKKKEKKPTYQFDVSEKATYVGGIAGTEYKNTIVTIIERSKTHNAENYKIEFEDGYMMTTILSVLKKIEVNNED